jgi:hypothetical protein
VVPRCYRGLQAQPAGQSPAPDYRDLDKSKRSAFVAAKAYRIRGQLVEFDLPKRSAPDQFLFDPSDAGRRSPQQMSELLDCQEWMSADEMQHLLPHRSSPARGRFIQPILTETLN